MFTDWADFSMIRLYTDVQLYGYPLVTMYLIITVNKYVTIITMFKLLSLSCYYNKLQQQRELNFTLLLFVIAVGHALPMLQG